MSFNINKSGLFFEKSPENICEQLSRWIGNNIPGISLIETAKDKNGKFTRAYFDYVNEPVGMILDYTGENIHLAAAYKVYVSESSSGKVTPHFTYSTGEARRVSLALSKYTENSVTNYDMGVWYATTDRGGLLVGLYTDDLNQPYQRYPVYIGSVFNDFLNEELIYSVQLNGGAYPTTSVGNCGMKAGEDMCRGRAMIIGEKRIEPDVSKRTYYNVLLQHMRSYKTYATDYTISYSALCGTLSNAWCPVFQVDNFFAAHFSDNTYPPMMEVVTAEGKQFITLSYDGVAVMI